MYSIRSDLREDHGSYRSQYRQDPTCTTCGIDDARSQHGTSYFFFWQSRKTKMIGYRLVILRRLRVVQIAKHAAILGGQASPVTWL
jgi:hypothetical protein